jgi:hypothetical protein
MKVRQMALSLLIAMSILLAACAPAAQAPTEDATD